MKTADQNRMIRSIAVYLVEQLMQLKSCSRDEAVSILMQTTVYEALLDTETDLYLESRESVFDILKEELAGNPYRLLTVDVSTESGVVLDDTDMFVSIEGERRVKDVMVGDEPLDPAKVYTLASHTYVLKEMGNGYSMFADNNFLMDSGMIDNQVLINYIIEGLGGVVGEDYADPYGQGRINIIDG